MEKEENGYNWAKWPKTRTKRAHNAKCLYFFDFWSFGRDMTSMSLLYGDFMVKNQNMAISQPEGKRLKSEFLLIVWYLRKQYKL